MMDTLMKAGSFKRDRAGSGAESEPSRAGAKWLVLLQGETRTPAMTSSGTVGMAQGGLPHKGTHEGAPVTSSKGKNVRECHTGIRI
jgi:hypothetical protein